MTMLAGIFAVLLSLLLAGLQLEARRLEHSLRSERERGWRDIETGLATGAVYLERVLIECKRAERRKTQVVARLLSVPPSLDMERAASQLDAATTYPAQAFRVGPQHLAVLQPTPDGAGMDGGGGTSVGGSVAWQATYPFSGDPNVAGALGAEAMVAACAQAIDAHATATA